MSTNSRSGERLQSILTRFKFQKIFVLNLPFRTDRRDAMSLSAAISNIKLDFVDGVTGDSIKQSAYPPPDENRKLLPGIRGSWRTHMNALQKYISSSARNGHCKDRANNWTGSSNKILQQPLSLRTMSTGISAFGRISSALLLPLAFSPQATMFSPLRQISRVRSNTVPTQRAKKRLSRSLIPRTFPKHCPRFRYHLSTRPHYSVNKTVTDTICLRTATPHTGTSCGLVTVVLDSRGTLRSTKTPTSITRLSLPRISF
jgi:hypothetical protein